jgi:hypothetical protein
MARDRRAPHQRVVLTSLHQTSLTNATEQATQTP